MANAVSFKFQGDIGAQLRRLADDIREKALRPAAYRVARIMYDEMKLRVPVHTGTLRDAIYHWHDDKRSTAGKQVYVIGPNKKKAPHWHLVEFGTARSAARPYIRSTYDAKITYALKAGKARLAEKIKELT